METTKMNVNPLPSTTWHWTGMNESTLEIVLPHSAPVLNLSGQTDGLRWTSSFFPKPDPADEPLKRFGWEGMETGMGEEFAAAMRKTPTAFLAVPDGYKGAGPAVLTVTPRKGQAAGQLLLHVGAGSEASVVISITGGEQASRDSNIMALQLLLHVESNAHLQLFVVQSLPRQGLSCLNIGGVCEEGAEASLMHLSLGAEKSCIGIAMALRGKESSFQSDMGYRVQTQQDVDINYVSRHFGQGSVSRMNAWGVLEEDSRKLFRGTIDFREGCPGSVGTEKEEVLLLGEHQICQTIPLILCHEEDVEGNHGAVISRLDDQMLFYLGSRGIAAEQAENMIAGARLEALCSRIPDREICAQTRTVIAADHILRETERETDR